MHGQPPPQAREEQRILQSCRPAVAPVLCCADAAVVCLTEGALTYALNSGDFFDPTELAEAVTPEAARLALSQRHYVKALLLALRLKDTDLLRHVMLTIPDDQVRQ